MKEYKLENVRRVSTTIYATLVTEYKFLWWSKVTHREVFRDRWGGYFMFLGGDFTPSDTVEMLYRSYEAQENLAKGDKQGIKGNK